MPTSSPASIARWYAVAAFSNCALASSGRFLDAKGEGFHHVCLEVPDVAATLVSLGSEGIELIDTAPRRGAEGPVAFLHPRSCGGVLVELIEAPSGPAWTALGYRA